MRVLLHVVVVFTVLSVWGVLISFWSVLVFSPTLLSLLFLLPYHHYRYRYRYHYRYYYHHLCELDDLYPVCLLREQVTHPMTKGPLEFSPYFSRAPTPFSKSLPFPVT